jgi:hypothetical protein
MLLKELHYALTKNTGEVKRGIQFSAGFGYFFLYACVDSVIFSYFEGKLP